MPHAILIALDCVSHVLFLTLLEAGFEVITTAPHFARQIKGRPVGPFCRNGPWTANQL